MSPSEYRIVSPKHDAMMALALGRVYSATFDESDIRTLVLGSRSFAESASRQSKSREDAPKAVRSGLAHLADIGHAIAHPELRDQGPLLRFVRKTDREMARSQRKMPTRRVLGVDPVRRRVDLAMPPAIKALSSADLVTAFCLAVRYSLPFDVEIERLLEHRADILLCLFSILHFSQMPDLDHPSAAEGGNEPRAGYLGLQSWDGRYSLYAGVMQSDMESILAAGKGLRERPFINTFPVFNGLKEVGSGFTADIFNPVVVFAVRDSTGELVLAPLLGPTSHA